MKIIDTSLTYQVKSIRYNKWAVRKVISLFFSAGICRFAYAARKEKWYAQSAGSKTRSYCEAAIKNINSKPFLFQFYFPLKVKLWNFEAESKRPDNPYVRGMGSWKRGQSVACVRIYRKKTTFLTFENWENSRY